MKQKQINPENLEIGKRYWIIEKRFKTSKFARPLLYIGEKEKRKYWFTFGENIDQWEHNFNYVCNKTNYKFYPQEEKNENVRR